MAVSYEKDYLDLNDIRKAVKEGRIRISPHAQAQAVRTDRNIDVQRDLEVLCKVFPTYDKPQQDKDEGMPGYMATIDIDGRSITGVFVQSSEIGHGNIIWVKTVYLYDPLYCKKQNETCRFDSVTNLPAMLSDKKVVSNCSVKVAEPIKASGFCANCSMAKTLMGKVYCHHHQISKVTAEGIVSVSMRIAEPDISACDGYKVA